MPFPVPQAPAPSPGKAYTVDEIDAVLRAIATDRLGVNRDLADRWLDLRLDAARAEALRPHT